LTELGAQAVLIEEHYVDRHFLDDFAGYYARSFRPIRAACARMHFFSLQRESLNELLDAVACSAEARDRAQLQLQETYLGFVVERPLRRAKVGRTVLRPYPREDRRNFTTVRPYHVHLDGIELTVKGLAFQQQDGGTAVCASTALWSALQRVAPLAGHRTPTPFAVTQAARSPFPAGQGLTTNGMATALSSLGYLADTFSPAAHLEWFCAQLTGCLQSQLPVILAISRGAKGHAVVVTGYSEPSGANLVGIPNSDVTPILMAGAAVETLYVRDDNLGAYAHYKLLREPDPQRPGQTQLMLVRGRHPEGTREGGIGLLTSGAWTRLSSQNRTSFACLCRR